MSKAIFFVIVFTIQILVNSYIFIRGCEALQQHRHLIPWFAALMILFTVAYPIGRWLDNVWYSPVSSIFHWIGAFWFAAMLYFVMALALIDLIRIINHFVGFLPDKSTLQYVKLRNIVALATVVSVVFTIIAGHINAWYPAVINKDITINKKAGSRSHLKVAAISDIHLGTIIGPRKTAKLVNEVNSLKPDIILLVGDVIDEAIKPVINQNLGKALSQLNAPLGVWAVPGNHEYIGGVDVALEYLKDHKINILADSTAFIDSSFYLAGRDDKSKNMILNQQRATISQLMANVDTQYPVIVMNHQPSDFDETAASGCDIHLSGHTHYGQLWPLGYITDKVFELARGYMKKGDTHFFVSTGFGTWGPPVRTGNRPEIIVINLTFSNK